MGARQLTPKDDMKTLTLFLPVAAILIAGGCATTGVLEEGPDSADRAGIAVGAAEGADPVSGRLEAVCEAEAALPDASAVFSGLVWDGEDTKLRYRLFSPALSAGVSYPLVVFFEGCDPGPGTAEGKSWAAVFCAPEAQAVNPCFVVVPEVPAGRSNRYELVNALVADLCECLPVDPGRVYATGFGAGGPDVCRIIAAAPGIYAAGAPVGGADPGTADAVGEVPFWVFDGDGRGGAEANGAARKFAGRLGRSRPAPRFTDYRGSGCPPHKMAYTNRRLFEWLFGQSRTQ